MWERILSEAWKTDIFIKPKFIHFGLQLRSKFALPKDDQLCRVPTFLDQLESPQQRAEVLLVIQSSSRDDRFVCGLEPRIGFWLLCGGEKALVYYRVVNDRDA
jgi:hypothetical protein